VGKDSDISGRRGVNWYIELAATGIGRQARVQSLLIGNRVG
jgi:hypothetical protein